MGTPRKIDAILLNIKINRPKLVNMCRYKLATYWQNFTDILNLNENSAKSFRGGATFLTHTVHVVLWQFLPKTLWFLHCMGHNAEEVCLSCASH